MEERKLPIGVQSFKKLREGNYLYVDKTEYIWNIVNSGSTYFLSRPRRFGKSLLISTIAAYFEGKKELFKGLAIEKHEDEKGEKAWQCYPVIWFYLASGNYDMESGLAETLQTTISDYEKTYSISHTDSDLPNQFRMLIRNLYRKTGKQVVVLVDEYDKPLLDAMDVNKEQEEKNRELYSSFFSVLKDEDQYIKFSFITGVTKFAKVSIFSGMNQPNDISMNRYFSAVCGITEKELIDNFEPEINQLAEVKKQSRENTLKELARMYDGYRFSEEGTGVYNPFSLLNAFYDNSCKNYWYATGTPTFLIHRLQQSTFNAEMLSEGVEASEAEITDSRADNPNPIPLFYQSGYLTITDYDPEFRIYTLKFPNEEVKYGFLESLVPFVLGEKDSENPQPVKQLVLSLRKGDLKTFIAILKALFAKMPYVAGERHSYEQEWRNEIWLVLTLLGQNAKCEVHTAEGRADCVIETSQYVYIFEYKLDKTAAEALRQINEKGYAEPYNADARTVYKVGINFSSEKRNIDDCMTIPEMDIG